MQWLEKTFERRKSPTSLWEEAKSAIVVGINYGPKVNPLTNNDKKLFICNDETSENYFHVFLGNAAMELC